MKISLIINYSLVLILGVVLGIIIGMYTTADIATDFFEGLFEGATVNIDLNESELTNKFNETFTPLFMEELNKIKAERGG